MGTKFDDFLAHSINLKPEEKISIARGAINVINDNLDKMGCDDDNKAQFILNLTKLFISADKELNGTEYSFFKAVTGTSASFDEFYEATNQGSDPKFVDATIDILQKLGSETAEAAFSYGMMIMSCDIKFDYRESELVRRILAIL